MDYKAINIEYGVDTADYQIQITRYLTDMNAPENDLLLSDGVE